MIGCIVYLEEVCVLPLASQVSLSTGDHRVSCQHFKGAGFPCPIHPQQTEALQQKRDTVCLFSQKFRLSSLHSLYLLYQPLTKPIFKQY